MMSLPPKPAAVLTGRRVLLAEDEYLIADFVRDLLLEAGAGEVVIVRSIAEAAAQTGGRRPDAALIDINLGYQSGYKLAELLAAHAVPFAFTTGYDLNAVDRNRFPTAPVLQKPFDRQRLIDLLVHLIQSTAGPLAPDPAA